MINLFVKIGFQMLNMKAFPLDFKFIKRRSIMNNIETRVITIILTIVRKSVMKEMFIFRKT